MVKITKKKSKKLASAMDKEKEFLIAIDDLAREKKLDKEVIYEAIEQALIAAYKKKYNTTQNVRVEMSRQEGSYHVYSMQKVVAGVPKDITECSLEEAKKINSDYEIGDIIEVEVTPAEFGRVAAQPAKQVIVQRLREAERGNIYDEFSKRKGDILTGKVRRVENKNVFVDLGMTEAILTPEEQIKGENYLPGDRIKVYIVEVKKPAKGPQIKISRTHPELLKRLFELEVPEIKDGTVEIKSVSREPGMRSKIAVYTKDEDIDPVGACVGTRGLRVQAIVEELRNEKIDIVKWSEDPAIYIANSLSPANVMSVGVNSKEKTSKVIVPDYQLSLAIGKEGQNARLAAKLTGWKIDIKSETQAQDDEIDPNMQVVEFLTSEEINNDSYSTGDESQ